MGNVQKAYSSFQRYVDVLSDSGFKAVFGDEANRDIIICFLNAVLPEGRRVRSLSFTRTEVPGFTAANRAVRLDLRCESESGRHLKRLGISEELISKASGLSYSEIRSL